MPSDVPPSPSEADPVSKRARKSRRSRKPPKYALDLLDPLKDVLSDEDDTSRDATPLNEDDEDDEFDANGIDELPDDDMGRSKGDAYDSSSVLSMGDEDAGMSSRRGSPAYISGVTKKYYARRLEARRTTLSGPDGSVRPYTTRIEHSTGAAFHDMRHGAKDVFLKGSYGSNDSDLANIDDVQVRWQYDPVLPLRVIDKQGTPGVASSPWKSEQVAEYSRARWWKWLDDYYGQEDSNPQRLGVIPRELGHTYLTGPLEDTAFLMGPHQNQELYKVGFAQSMDISEAWKSASVNAKQHTGSRDGWLLNVGGRVDCMDWAPNRSSNDQVLALSVCRASEDDGRKNSTFVPIAGPSSIQLWRLPTSKEPERSGRMDLKKKPQLFQVICTDWADLKQLKWCPVSRKQPESNLGLIATVWGDGKVRVLDVDILRDSLEDTCYGMFHTENIYLNNQLTSKSQV
jgi:transcription factor C subunit 6